MPGTAASISRLCASDNCALAQDFLGRLNTFLSSSALRT